MTNFLFVLYISEMILFLVLSTTLVATCRVTSGLTQSEFQRIQNYTGSNVTGKQTDCPGHPVQKAEYEMTPMASLGCLFRDPH